MRFFSLFSLFIFFPIKSNAQHLSFDLELSSLYGTYDFISKLSDYYPENEMKTLFLASSFNQQKNADLIREMDMLYIDYGYDFPQYQPQTKYSVDTRSLLEKNLITSHTIAEFKQRTIGIVPYEELTDFSQIMTAFLPVYDSLVLTPYASQIRQQVTALRNYMETNDVADLFKRGEQFYGVQWDKKIPFRIAVIPKLNAPGISARAFLNCAIIEIPIDFKSYADLFSVLTHEVFHILYDQQTLAQKDELINSFHATGSPNSQYGFLLLNEVLATALGNGYVYEQLKQRPDKAPWYYVKYVDQMAKAIYPTLKQYIKDEKTIDSTFVKEYMRTYDTAFSTWVNELDHILTYRSVLTDDETDLRYFRHEFYQYTYHKSGFPISPIALEKIKNEPVTKVIVISKDHKQRLNEIRAFFPTINLAKKAFKKEFIAVFNLPDRTRLILINRYQTQTGNLIKKYFPDRKL